MRMDLPFFHASVLGHNYCAPYQERDYVDYESSEESGGEEDAIEVADGLEAMQLNEDANPIEQEYANAELADIPITGIDL